LIVLVRLDQDFINFFGGLGEVEGVDYQAGFSLFDSFPGTSKRGGDDDFLASHTFDDDGGKRVEVEGGDKNGVCSVVGSIELGLT
jgi:hypothetical protein